MPNEPKRLEYPITENYSPEVAIEITGLNGNNKSLVAIVDTGFTGFLQIPLSAGIACNLRLWGTSKARLADGSEVKNLECVGEVRFADKKLFNIISLSEGGEDCLLGMQFLNELKMDFVVSVQNKKAIFIEKIKNKEVLKIPEAKEDNGLSPTIPQQNQNPPLVSET
jgi:predicted aspartyl protease